MGKAVLLVSANPEDRNRLRLCLCNCYEVIESDDFGEAHRVFEGRKDDICLVVADIAYWNQTEEISGPIRKLSARVPVIAYSSGTDGKLESAALDAGVREIIRRPFLPAVVRKRTENTRKLFDLERQAESIRVRRDRIEGIFASTVENRSTVVKNHAARIRRYTEALLRHICGGESAFCHYGEKQILDISDAAALHDIGKIAVPEAILQKPGPLTRTEFEMVKQHTVRGCELLRHLDGVEDPEFLEWCRIICRSHHERCDGGGYPDGLSGDEIPVGAQAVGIADVYDALRSKLVYKAPIAHDRAVEMIASGQCGAFAPHLVQAFFAVAEQFRSIAQAYPS